MSSQEYRRIKRIRQTVIDRDGLICCYCNEALTLENYTLDHIVPDSKMGTFNATNLTVACSFCNGKRGNQPFFEFCKNYNWSNKKISKYKTLYLNNLKIKILNIAKEQFLNSDEAVPQSLLNKAAKKLNVKNIDLTSYQEAYQLDICFDELCHRKKIKFNFEKLIKIIEETSY